MNLSFSKTIQFILRDILKEMQKCEKELEKISNELPMYEQIYNKAKKEYENKRKRKIDLEDFIVLVKEELKEKEKK